MSIKRVFIDDYSDSQEIRRERVEVSEFAGRLVIGVGDDFRIEVLPRDLFRAWDAVKVHD